MGRLIISVVSSVCLLAFALQDADAQYRTDSGYSGLYDSETAAAMRRHVREVASAANEGRRAGSEGEKNAAAYLYDVLENALERELKKERKSRPELRGASGTNNFYAGVRQALRERLEKERDDEQSPAKALMIISRDNEDRTRRIVYPDARITRRKARHIYNETAWKEGLSCGKRLQLRAAVKKENTLSLSLPSGKL